MAIHHKKEQKVKTENRRKNAAKSLASPASPTQAAFRNDFRIFGDEFHRLSLCRFLSSKFWVAEGMIVPIWAAK
jgi:hypothetical protein